VWHKISSHTIVGVVEQNSHDGSLVEMGGASPREDVTSDAKNWRLCLIFLIEMVKGLERLSNCTRLGGEKVR
jgi:hypothetical protein